MQHTKLVTAAAFFGLIALTLTGCGTTEDAASNEITIVTNSSWTLPDDGTLNEYREKTGVTVNLVNGEESGTLDSKLILTKDNPVGDAVVGLTANNIVKVAAAGVFDTQVEIKAPAGAEKYAVADAPGTVALDRSDACFNYDIAYFQNSGLQPPKNLDDLLKPEYKGLSVIEDPAKSDTGFALLTATIKEYGEDGYLDYWQKLLANDTKVDSGWDDAYNVDFTLGESGTGKYPIVMSYASSPYWTMNPEKTASTTANVPGGCYPVVDYGAVLKGAKNPQAAAEFLSWLGEPETQTILANANVTYPIDESAELPEGMAEFAPRPDTGNPLDPKLIANSREKWLAAVAKLL